MTHVETQDEAARPSTTLHEALAQKSAATTVVSAHRVKEGSRKEGRKEGRKRKAVREREKESEREREEDGKVSGLETQPPQAWRRRRSLQ